MVRPLTLRQQRSSKFQRRPKTRAELRPRRQPSPIAVARQQAKTFLEEKIRKLEIDQARLTGELNEATRLKQGSTRNAIVRKINNVNAQILEAKELIKSAVPATQESLERRISDVGRASEKETQIGQFVFRRRRDIKKAKEEAKGLEEPKGFETFKVSEGNIMNDDGKLSQAKFDISRPSTAPPPIKQAPVSFFGSLKDIFVDFTKPMREGVRGTATPQQKQFFDIASKAGADLAQSTEKISRGISEFVSPDLKALRQQEEAQNRTIKRIEDQLREKNGQLNQKVGEFNIRAESGQATPLEQKQLEAEIKTFEKQIAQLEIRRKGESEKLEKRRKRLLETPAGFATSAVSSFVSSPFDIAGLAGSVLADPVKTSKDIVGGIKELPSTFKVSPFTTAGTIIGGLAFDVLVSASLLKTATKVRKIVSAGNKNVRVNYGFSISDVKEIGKDAFGNKRFRVKSTISSKIVDAKTGRQLDVITTDVGSEVIVANTKEGAIRTASNSISQSLSKGGFREFASDGRVTAKLSTNQASGKGTFNVKEDSFVGTAQSKVTEIGTTRLKLDLDLSKSTLELSKRITKTKTPLEFDVLSNIKGKKILDISKADVTLSKILSDVTQKKLRVSSFVKQADITRRISATTRRFPRTVKGGKVRFEKFDRGLSFDLSRIFRPTKAEGGFGIKILKGKKTGKPIFASQDITQKVKFADIAKVTGQAEAKGLAQTATIKSLEGLTKPTVRTTTKISQRVVVKPAQAVVNINKTLSNLDLTSSTRQKALSSSRFDLLSVTKQSTRPREDLRDRDLLAQVGRLKLGTSLLTKQGLSTVSPLVPVIPTQPPILPKRLKRFGAKRIISPSSKKELEAFDKLSRTPYDVLVKRGRKFRKVEDNIKFNLARSVGSYLTDTTTSARFKVVKSAGKLKKPKRNIPSMYWNFNRHKFRPFRIKQRRRIPLKQTWIEKRRFRIDSFGETRGLKRAKMNSITGRGGLNLI